jgi:hypothetical protein
VRHPHGDSAHPHGNSAHPHGENAYSHSDGAHRLESVGRTTLKNSANHLESVGPTTLKNSANRLQIWADYLSNDRAISMNVGPTHRIKEELGPDAVEQMFEYHPACVYFSALLV